MPEPAPPPGLALACFVLVCLGVYTLLAAFALEWYPLVAAAVLCFLGVFPAAARLGRRPS